MRFCKLFCLLLTAAVLFAGCGNKKDSSTNEKDKLAISVPGTVTGELNPFFASEKGDIEILAALSACFFTTEGIAEATEEIREDGTLAVTVTISDGILCADKSRLNAADLIYAVLLVCDPTYDGPYTDLAQSSLVGLAEFRSGESKELSGVERLGDLKVQVLFSDPEEDYRTLLDLPAVRTANYGDYTYGKCTREDVVAKRAKVMGPGPYQLDLWFASSDRVVNLEANEYYRGGEPNTQKLVLCGVQDSDVGLNIRLGQLTAGFLYDKEEAQRQAEEYGFATVMLADGALLCKKNAAFISLVDETDTIVQAITVITAVA